MEIDEEMLDRIVPEFVCCENYAPYMRIIQLACGKLQWKLYLLKGTQTTLLDNTHLIIMVRKRHLQGITAERLAEHST